MPDDLISLEHPKGVQAVRMLMDAIITNAQVNALGPDIILSSCVSMLGVLAKNATPSTRIVVSESIKNLAAMIDANSFPNEGEVLSPKSVNLH